MAKKERADKVLVTKGLVESLEQAQLAIREGRVRIGPDHVIRKPSERVRAEADLVVAEPPAYVSRGAGKLLPALKRYYPDLSGRIGLDIGASTGGFTDLMLQHGADRVYAVDVGHGQLHWKLRQDERVVVHEKVNCRYLAREHVPEPVDVVAIDVSFISLTLILPVVPDVARPGATVFALIKPQFEARPECLRKGVVTDPAVRDECVSRIVGFTTAELGWQHLATLASPVKGPKGNQEFVAVLVLPSDPEGVSEE